MTERPIEGVVSAILKVVPENEPVKPALTESLMKSVRRSRFTAPEAMHVRWAEVSRSLEQHLGDQIDAEWKKTVAAIATGEADFRNYLLA